MNFKVYNKKKKEEEIYFALQEREEQSNVCLVIVGKDGRYLSSVASISSDGLHLHTNIPEHTNLPLDKDRRICIDK